ncbi:FAD-dependent oxidoreductase [Streptomyces diastatochromogenes]|nr:FAD-dependent oxidoreductase [Streptomyces diastatochromogenes]
MTSDDALFAPGLPGSVLVLGGGAIGVEYASFHRSMGAEVTLVEAADRIVPLEDADVSRHLTRGLKKRGVDVRAGARLLDAEVLENGVRARVRTARGETRTVEAERLLVAVGRVPVTEGLDLAAAGLTTDERGSSHRRTGAGWRRPCPASMSWATCCRRPRSAWPTPPSRRACWWPRRWRGCRRLRWTTRRCPG